MPKGIWRHRSKRLEREEYLSRAYEFAHHTPQKLDAEKVLAIRVRHSMGVPAQRMAEQYGVSKSMIDKVAAYDRW